MLHRLLPQEHERKFLLRSFPPASYLQTVSIITQGYLLRRPIELRLRRIGPAHTITLKTTGTGSRLELETPIPPRLFDILWRFTGTCHVHKLRYRWTEHAIPHELHVFFDREPTLMLLECEFPSVNAARAYTLPTWARDAIDVTEDRRYYAANLTRTSPPLTPVESPS